VTLPAGEVGQLMARGPLVMRLLRQRRVDPRTDEAKGEIAKA